MKKFLIFILILIVIVFIAFKFIVKPQDLGIKTDPTFVSGFESKYGKSDGSGKVNLDVNLADSEITSIFSVWEQRDKDFPLKNVQVKFNSDGIGEASGLIKIGTVVSLAKNLGYSDSEIETGKQYIKYVSGDIPFYVNGTAHMTNNILDINPSSFKIAKISVPDTLITPINQAVSDMIYRRIKQIGGADIKEANFKSGSFHLLGTVPETIKY